MKKICSWMGALFLGSAAFAQVSKTDSTNKTVSRKVLTEDVKDLPADNVHNQGTGTDKGRTGGHTQKISGDNFTIKGNKNELPAEKHNYPFKMSNTASKAAADSTEQQNTKIHIKTPSKKD